MTKYFMRAAAVSFLLALSLGAFVSVNAAPIVDCGTLLDKNAKPPGGVSFESKSKFKIMTFNVENFFESGSAATRTRKKPAGKVKEIFQVLKDEDPDVVIMPEVGSLSFLKS